jgi:hypothetical protein
MTDELSERLLARVMGWAPDRHTRERVHLQILANCKYDSYEQYRPGAKFITSLALWLRTFTSQVERESAYQFILSRLIFISNREMGHLVVTSYPYHIRPYIIRRVASSTGRALYPTQQIASSDEFSKARRRCLYLGLSDGARSDSFRRGNSREIGNEQIVATYQISEQKAKGLLKDLRKSLHEPEDKETSSRFDTIVFLDDFNGSGTTLYRLDEGKPDGKLPRIIADLIDPTKPLGAIVDQANLLVLFVYYVSTEEALVNARAAIASLQKPTWMTIHIEAVQPIPRAAKVERPRDDAMCGIVEHPSYYDEEASKDEHLRKGGVDHARYGFAGSSLPLILGHNTPNNSIFLLWSTDDYAIQGLFPRVPRHRPE